MNIIQKPIAPFIRFKNYLGQMPPKRRRGIILYAAIAAAILLPIAIAFSNAWILHSTRSRMYSTIAEIPANEVALILGARPDSPFCQLRLKAGADLYKAGKVRHLLVSGDNHIRSYDEPTDMKAYLVAMGVPANCITCDYAGFRTLDSIVRAREIFGLSRFTIVSQAYHNPRALAIAAHYGLDAIAYNAPDVSWRHRSVTAREMLARPLAMLDIYVLQRKPRFLGAKETIVPGKAE
jgi:vancomycin permeability regulator SanA